MMLPLFHVHGAIRVEYRVVTRALGQNIGAIESETQAVGGNAGLCALALARLGARVRLSGNALGDDSHGRFLRAQLQAANLETDLTARAGVVTPYAILQREGDGPTLTLLSPQAQHLVLPPLPSFEDEARVLDFGKSNQSYGALLDDLRVALRAWLSVARTEDSAEQRELRLSRWIEELDKGFGALPFSP